MEPPMHYSCKLLHKNKKTETLKLHPTVGGCLEILLIVSFLALTIDFLLARELPSPLHQSEICIGEGRGEGKHDGQMGRDQRTSSSKQVTA